MSQRADQMVFDKIYRKLKKWRKLNSQGKLKHAKITQMLQIECGASGEMTVRTFWRIYKDKHCQ